MQDVSEDETPDQRLARAVTRMLAQRSWSRAELARRMSRDGAGRVHDSTVKRIIESDRAFTPEMTRRVAAAFGLTAYALREQAGVLTAEERRARMHTARTPDVIAVDPLLDDEARAVMLTVYRRLTSGATSSVRGRSTTDPRAE